MKTITVYDGQVNERAISEATSALAAGDVIIYPTDTLYALGCDALNAKAIEKLCRYKGINPDRQLLSVVCADMKQASEYARIDNRAFALLKRYLPGPFTFVLPASNTLPKVFKGRKTVGVRIPDNMTARALAAELGHPVLTTSVSVAPDDPYEAMTPESIAMNHEHIASMMIDGGEGGTEPSTVVDLRDSSAPEVIRQGKGEWEE